ncbi:hypothetical protein SAMN05443247_08157 [Bradyrhizobium erythrophlei]|nr:hypothetical protein SAMN05443247_08157 [Bradyrhizobium erythrophlei]
MMHGREKSDSAIVAEKPTNKVVFGHCGAGGAKGGGQGECEPAKHASDTVPKMRVTGAGAHTASSPSLTQGGRSYGAGGGGCGTFIVHTNQWRLPRGPSQ